MMAASLGWGEWFRNPVSFKVADDGFVLQGEGSGFAIRYELPLSKKVAVEGIFTLAQSSPSEEWHVAGVAVVESESNFWHLALVKAPEGRTPKYFFELSEMLDGRWLSQSSLKVEFEEYAKGMKIAPGSRWHMNIAMDEQGITGVVKDENGKTVYRKRYLFSKQAVTCGRPALHSTGLNGKLSELKFSIDEKLALKSRQQSFPPYQSDNFIKEVSGKATGFFYVRQNPDGRWWAIDPLGRGVVVLGVDHTTFWGHWCETLGYHPYRKKNEKKYKDSAEWERETLARLKKWGFTMLGAGSQESLRRRGLYHCVNLGIGTHFATFGEKYYITPNEKRPCSAFPNVFHPEFEQYCRYVARNKCALNDADQWMFGYFTDNELAWWGRGKPEIGLFDAAMKFDGGHTAKLALLEFLKQKSGASIEKFNALWKTKCGSFDDALKLTELSSNIESQIQVKHDFLKLVAERYFSITTKAVREVDPNHMVLGARFAGTGGADPVVWQITGKYCDVVTFNCYPNVDMDEGLVYNSSGKDAELVPEHFEKFYNYVRKPMLVTEWSFPALDAGLPSVHGAGQRFFTQKGRTAATELFARTMLSLPFLIGYDYFMWVDEPALGICTSFPEDSNYGLVNEEGKPYPLLTDMFTELHGNLWQHRNAQPPPRKRVVRKQPLTPMESALKLKAQNPGAEDVVFTKSGDKFVVDNGRLKLEGSVGAGCFIEKISLDGKLYGSYNAMLHIENTPGRSRWQDIQQVTSVNCSMQSGCAVIEISGLFKQSAPFEITHRVIVPPGSAKFVCEVLRIRNTGEKELAVKGLYFRFYGADKKWGVTRSPRNVWGVPESGCWMQEESGAYLGALASYRCSGVKINFWKDETHKSFHPDAVYAVDLTLKPGAVYKPERTVSVIGVPGIGGKDGWMQELKDANAFLEKAR